MADIRLDSISRRFGDMTAVDDISITFPEGRVTCLLGPSGCGKTTLMRMIAGLETPSEGRIFFGERDVTALGASRRNVAMVFQYPVTYRTLSVEENIALAMHRDHAVSSRERQQRLDEVIAVLGLENERGRAVDRLDAGTRQRVAVGRAIVRRCDVILFDEPTTNVDVHAKLQLIRAFNAFRARLRQTIIYVTHDQTEAMTLADQIALMQSGNITQMNDPRSLYEHPRSEFAGWFLGNPGMNFLAPSGEHDGVLRFDGLARPVRRPPGDIGRLRAGIRPERVEVALPGDAGVEAKVLRRSITIGGQYLLLVGIGDTRLRVRAPVELGPRIAGTVSIRCPLEHVTFFRDGGRLEEQPQAIG